MTYYEILEVDKNASGDIIRASYRALAKKYHPDTFRGDPAVAEEKMKLLNQAHEILSNPEKRRQYDETLRNQQASAYQSAQNRTVVNEEQSPPVQEKHRQTWKDFGQTKPSPKEKKRTPIGLVILIIVVVLLAANFDTFFSGRNGWVEDGGKTYYYRDGKPVKGLTGITHKSSRSDDGYDIYYGFDKDTGELLTGKVPADRLMDLFGEALLADEITVKLKENGAYEYERWVWSDVPATWAKGDGEPSAYFKDYSVIPDFLAQNVVYLSLEAEGIEPVSGQELNMYCLDRDGKTWGSGEESYKVYWSGGSNAEVQYDPKQGTAKVEINAEEPDSEYWDGETFVQKTGNAYPFAVNGVCFYFSGPETEDGYILTTDVQHSSVHIKTLIQRHENQYESALIDMFESEQKRQEMQSNVPYKGALETVGTTEAGYSYPVYYGYDKETGELLTGRVPADRFVELGGESLLADEITVVLDDEGKWDHEEWVFSDLDIVTEWESEGEEPWKNGHYLALPWNYAGNIQYVVFEATGAKPVKAVKNGEWWIRYCTDYQEDQENTWYWGSVKYDAKTDALYAEIDLRETVDYRRSIDVFALMYVSNPDDEENWKVLESNVENVTIKKMVQHRTQYNGILSDANW